MNFIKLIETRFADPVTALDLSSLYVCHGSAMGRIGFYCQKDGKDVILSDSQPELVRGISHSLKGDNIFVSIGDISCKRINAQDLQELDQVWIVENIEDRTHKSNCERAYTLLSEHYNCVLTVNVQGKQELKKDETYVPIMLSNLETNILDNYGENEFEFDQNSVPCDFDGQRLLWMQYLSKDLREVYIYDFEKKQKQLVMQFNQKDGLVSHLKLMHGQTHDQQIFYVRNSKVVIKYDVSSKTQAVVGQSKDSILAMCVTRNEIREFDKPFSDLKGFNDSQDEEKKESDMKSFYIACIDESEHLSIFSHKNASNAGRGGFQKQVRDCPGIPTEIKDKDLFGMGYPYLVSMYGDKVAFSTDYGICLVRVNNNMDF